MKVVISGSLTVGSLPVEARQRIDTIISLGADILVGDAPGIDAAVQQYLKSKGYSKITVYYVGPKPRNNAGFQVYRVNGSYTVRDTFMCNQADYGLAIWNGRSKGTKRNIEQLGNRMRVVMA